MQALSAVGGQTFSCQLVRGVKGTLELSPYGSESTGHIGASVAGHLARLWH